MNTARLLDRLDLIRDALFAIEAITTTDNVNDMGGEIISSAMYFTLKAVREELDRAEAEVRKEVRTA